MNVISDVAATGLSIQRECESDSLPDDEDIRRIAAVALADLDEPVLNLRIVDEAEGRELNRRWRGRDRATNVLSFPAELPEGVGINLLGDIVLCAPVLEREAAEQGKSARAHFAHLLIHGILHLRGFDHMSAEQAEVMESREIRLLADLGVGDPYLSDYN
ncbi:MULTISPECIES: rRNA maturation RNase YbeY [unclassified Wenzhouxiangella]|uniref:rRNA maturation RNase YbeY n=1 Tax=unclassified Wenzhouxiangella TaxID=2613841 RepID=UPI000E32881D|nr:MULTISPECIES: rRNA maturation RNase YbeY [unclassified Wenzhouxiangella]RFF27759.1 rRNA maturation RNase YbeY [Wenzhouxiangella sp. 15181]RFP68388.1 rRNA maturation RNase YbeY [Wenzhouxiangella sp. 15190]